MYSTCLFCNRPLGRNEVVETFPIGRRLAFDAALGRLWVVCLGCERWNLTPLEERWEAIEQCERLFRDTRVRVSTDQIGLAKLKEGLVLVRVGAPQRPEFAAWRYGDQLGRRRRRQLMVTGAAAAAGAALVGWGVFGLGIGIGSAWVLRDLPRALVQGSPEKVVAMLDVDAAAPVKLRRKDLATVKIVPGDAEYPMALRVTTGARAFRVDGAAAIRAASRLLPHVNRFGGDRDDVTRAVRQIEVAGDSTAFLSRVANASAARRRSRTNWVGEEREIAPDLLSSLLPSERLALEMAVHEEQERRALEGELAELEQAWRTAEEIARIADDLFLPSSVERMLARLRSARGGERG